MKQKQVKAKAKEVLGINLNFGPEESLQLKAAGNFNHRQLASVSRMGIKMSQFGELKEQEDKLLFEYEVLKTFTSQSNIPKSTRPSTPSS